MIEIQEQLVISFPRDGYCNVLQFSIPESLVLYEKLRNWLQKNDMIDPAGNVVWEANPRFETTMDG